MSSGTVAAIPPRYFRLVLSLLSISYRTSAYSVPLPSLIEVFRYNSRNTCTSSHPASSHPGPSPCRFCSCLTFAPASPIFAARGTEVYICRIRTVRISIPIPLYLPPPNIFVRRTLSLPSLSSSFAEMLPLGPLISNILANYTPTLASGRTAASSWVAASPKPHALCPA